MQSVLVERIQEIKTIVNTRKVLHRNAISPMYYITVTLGKSDLRKVNINVEDFRYLHLYIADIRVGDRVLKALILAPEKLPALCP
jgi:hypothetical protein